MDQNVMVQNSDSTPMNIKKVPRYPSITISTHADTAVRLMLIKPVPANQPARKILSILPAYPSSGGGWLGNLSAYCSTYSPTVLGYLLEHCFLKTKHYFDKHTVPTV